ncbi:dihydrolipoamide acetyltransferase family protein [Blastococcus sp. KM273129]|uniref:dihydrolipoamide acetyltransferase family protein n=1 Tax=Blastococcus sp. KM273129 TaxID=2570315 RepID=UPI001F15767D|nr:dihydrolipoamide acetyltransferase family protein [Blastococcus sp. KM273129]
MTQRQFKLPDVGEGLTEGEILQWMVAVGDTVAVNQPLCEVETAKAAVELPSPWAGTVVELLHEAGTMVDVGAPIITIDVGGGAPAAESSGEQAAGSPEPAAGLIGGAAPGGRTAVLVGYGPRTTEARRRPRRSGAAAAARATALPGADYGSGGTDRPPLPSDDGPPLLATAPDMRTKPVRHGGLEVGRQASAFTAPHATEFLTVDVTRTMKLRSRLAARPELAGVKVSPLLFVARAVLLAARRHPLVNSSWDEAAQEIVVHGQVNLGIAAATPRGLIVPNVKDAGRLSLAELAGALAELTETARAGRTAPEDMTGGTLTITNVGVFGVDTGTPILNPGESAILAFGAVREMPWVHKGKVRPRQVTQLALSFDHRIIDGELGSRFLADVGALLHDPGTALAF